MAGDLADIGFRAETSQLKGARADLQALVPAAAGAERAAEQLAGAFDQEAAAAARGATATKNAANTMRAAAGQMSVAANDNIRSMGGSFSGMAAQFQDIGVTAAMGMNPLIIGLQQGSQMAGQLEMAMRSGTSAIGVFGQAFKSILSPVTFVTIALVSLVAAGLQMVDWASLAKSALEFIAEGLDDIAPYAIAAAAGIALLYAPTIIGGLSKIPALLYGIERAMLAVIATISWPALLIAGIIALGAAAVAFRDDLTRILGVDIVGAAKAGANYLINSFLVAYERIKTIWGTFPDMIQAALTGAKNFFTGGEQNEAADRLAKAWAESDKRAAELFNNDTIGQVGGAIGDGISYASSKLKELAGNIDLTDSKADKAAAKAKARYQDIVQSAQSAIASNQAELAAVGMSEEATLRLRYETDLLNQAKEKELVLTTAQTEELRKLAGEMAATEVAAKKAKDNFEFAKSAVKGFVSDLRSGLEQGKGFWESLGDAAMNVLDKITDKLLNDVIDALFEVNKAGSSGGGGGGFFSNILGALFSAKGNVFTPNGVEKFAKGGVVDNATAFTYAQGGSLGVMGEAGPEAVMPLTRGPDGNLGVRMYGGDGGSGGAPVINFEVVVNGEANVRREQENRGGVQVERVIIDTVNRAILNGDFDAANNGQYGLRSKTVAR
jgi:hypothetical protein